MHAARKTFLLMAGMMMLACSGDFGFARPRPLLNTRFEDWCGETPCGWELKAGSTKRTSTWHEHEYAAELVGDGSEIAQRASRPSGTCMRIDVVSRSDDGTSLKLALDFDGDDLTDEEYPLVGAAWKRHTLILNPPESYAVARYVFKKSGPGSAAIASIGTGDAGQQCYGDIRLKPGSYCISDNSCVVDHRCVDGICSQCQNGACDNDAPCDVDAQCSSGTCAGGRCADCARSGSCAARAPCSTSSQCQSGTCVFGSVPSEMKRPEFDGVCAECSNDGQCANGRCVLGFCSECTSDEQCGGLSCRYGDRVDAVEKACRVNDGGKRGRGQLCESEQDCEGLPCGAAPGRAERCGVSCATDADCGDGVCGVLGARALPNSSERVFIPALSNQPEARVRTCFPKLGVDLACTVDDQCPDWRSACCDGSCQSAIVNRSDAMCTNELAVL